MPVEVREERRSRGWIFAVAALLIAALVIGADIFWRSAFDRYPRQAPGPRRKKNARVPPQWTPPAPSTGAVPEKSIAVLPFENLSDDKTERFLHGWRAG